MDLRKKLLFFSINKKAAGIGERDTVDGFETNKRIRSVQKRTYFGSGQPSFRWIMQTKTPGDSVAVKKNRSKVGVMHLFKSSETV